jgi:tape measure domain-containing protein
VLLAFGFTAIEVKENLKALGDVAAGSGTPLGELGRVFGQVAAAGKLTGERLLQFQERAVPIGPALAKTMGVAESSIKELVSAGKVSFKDFEKAFKSLSKEGGIFENAMIKQSKTLAGVFSTLKDNVQLALGELGQEIATAFDLREITKSLISKIQSITKWFSELDKGTKKTIIVIAGLTAIVGPLLVALGFLMTTVVPGLVTALAFLKASFITLNAVMLANPITAIAAGVAILITAFVLLNKETKEVIKSQSILSDITDKAAKSISGEKAKLTELLAVARDERIAKRIRIDALNEINRISPKYLGNLTLEKINTDEAKKSVDLYNSALLESARIRAAQEKLRDITSKIIEAELKHAKGLRAADKQRIEIQKISNDLEDTKKLKLAQNKALVIATIGGYNMTISKLKEEESIILDIIKANKLNNTVVSGGENLGGGDDLEKNTTAGIFAFQKLLTAGKDFSGEFKDVLIKTGESVAVVPQKVVEGLTAAEMRLKQFSDNVKNVIGGSLANTFSDLGNSIGEALANGENVFAAAGNSLLNSISNFLSDMGRLLIEYGTLAVIKGTLDTAIAVGGPVAIAAGIAAIAVGTALSIAGGALGALATSGSSDAGGGLSSSGASGGSSFRGGSTQGAGGGGFSGGTVVFEVAGTKLVGVLKNTLDRNRALGGSLGFTSS